MFTYCLQISISFTKATTPIWFGVRDTLYNIQCHLRPIRCCNCNSYCYRGHKNEIVAVCDVVVGAAEENSWNVDTIYDIIVVVVADMAVVAAVVAVVVSNHIPYL